jgi:NAD-dependent deacetylase
MQTTDVAGVSGKDYQALLLKLRQSRSAMAFSGAGLSAESGIPTFRDDPQGVWAKLRPEDYASVEGFRRDMLGVWQWYWDRRESAGECSPNAAHHAIAKLQRALPTYVGTQNVDGLLTRAGCSSVYEMHGSLSQYRCLECKQEAHDSSLFSREAVPVCQNCGGPVRPAVVWFGEPLGLAEFDVAEQQAAKSDVFFSVGTSGEVYPAASLPQRSAVFGNTLIIINPAPTAHDSLTPYTFRARAGELLPKLLTDAGLI